MYRSSRGTCQSCLLDLNNIICIFPNKFIHFIYFEKSMHDFVHVKIWNKDADEVFSVLAFLIGDKQADF